MYYYLLNITYSIFFTNGYMYTEKVICKNKSFNRKIKYNGSAIHGSSNP